MLSLFDLIAFLLVLTAAFGWLNQRFARLPYAIGLVVMGLASSLVLIGAEAAFVGLVLYRELTGLLHRLNFRAALLDGMLAFLLRRRAPR